VGRPGGFGETPMALHSLHAPQIVPLPVKPRRFDAVTIAFHWATVVLIVGMFASAWLMSSAHHHALAGALLTLHRSMGVSLWGVAVGRLCWRLSFSYLPPFPPTMSKRQQTLAKISEYGLYALLLAQPLTGLAQTVAWGRPFVLFGAEVPAVMNKDAAATELFHNTHEFSAWVLLSLIGLHILAALFHRFVLRDNVLQSMLPWRPSAPSRPPAARCGPAKQEPSWPRRWRG
jgi:superoxide oxidase